jgi:hypothetical protein
MRRALPSDVVKAIEEQFSWTKKNWKEQVSQRNEGRFYGVTVIPGILRLVERIPEELIILDSATDSKFTLAIHSLEYSVVRGQANPNDFLWPVISVPGTSEQEDCLTIVRNALLICPDQAPSQSSKQLTFLKDKVSRLNLGIDLGSAERAVHAGEWKTATVLAASVTEALLLWAIKEHSDSEIAAAVQQAPNVNKRLPANDLVGRSWTFGDYIGTARALSEIDERTASRCRDAKDYRNLIHAGAAEREKEECNRATAHGALCAVYATIKDLEERHPSAGGNE